MWCNICWDAAACVLSADVCVCSLFALVASMHSTLKLYGNCKANAHLPGLGNYQSLMDEG